MSQCENGQVSRLCPFDFILVFLFLFLLRFWGILLPVVLIRNICNKTLNKLFQAIARSVEQYTHHQSSVAHFLAAMRAVAYSFRDPKHTGYWALLQWVPISALLGLCEDQFTINSSKIVMASARVTQCFFNKTLGAYRSFARDGVEMYWLQDGNDW